MIRTKQPLLVVGKNLFSVLFSLAKASQGDSVLLIKEPEESISSAHFFPFSELHRTLLEELSIRLHFEEVGLTDHFLTPQPFALVIGQKRLHLGVDPATNLNELIRKFGNPFTLKYYIDSQEDRDLFNVSFLQALTYFSAQILRNSNDHELLNCYDRLFPYQLREIVDGLEGAHSEFQHLFNTFLYPLSTHYLSSARYYSLSRLELWMLVTGLLSPTYHFDENSFYKTVTPLIKKFRLTELATSIKQIQVSRKKPWAVEFCGFEGVKEVSAIHFFKTFISPQLLSTNLFDEGVTALEVTFKKKKPDAILGISPLLYINPDLKIYSPSWLRLFESRLELSLTIPLSLLPASKESFWEGPLLPVLENFLKEHLDFTLIERDRFTYISYFEALRQPTKKLLQSSSTEFYLPTDFEKKNRLKEICYHGPAIKEHLGILTSFSALLQKPAFRAKTWFNKGQAMVEYVLFLAVLIAILSTLTPKVRDWLMADAGNCTPASKSVICKVTSAFSPTSFRTFRIMY